ELSEQLDGAEQVRIVLVEGGAFMPRTRTPPHAIAQVAVTACQDVTIFGHRRVLIFQTFQQADGMVKRLVVALHATRRPRRRPSSRCTGPARAFRGRSRQSGGRSRRESGWSGWWSGQHVALCL